MLGIVQRKVYNFYMQRIKLVLEYNGSKFCGWQRQKNARSVQQELEKALSKLFGKQITVVGSSRTDAKVHAMAQVAHFDCSQEIPVSKIAVAVNSLLPDDVKVLCAKKVGNDFHARFDVKKKTYRYYLYKGKKNAILNDLVATCDFPLDESAMQQCLKLFVGKHNFKAFCASGAQVKSYEREIYDARLTKKGKYLIFEFTGNGFMQHMVRILVGTCVDVGRGAISLQQVQAALESGKRALAGKTMPPQGLYLKKIYF